ncbi:MAG: NAD(P)-binding domain-containing protein, partial [Verrucomicrobiota bacterium]
MPSSDSETPSRAFRNIAILGPGLLGGSLALALKDRGVRVWARREQALQPIKDRIPGVIASTDFDPVISGADLVILATPIGAMPGIAERLMAFAPSDQPLLGEMGPTAHHLHQGLTPRPFAYCFYGAGRQAV